MKVATIIGTRPEIIRLSRVMAVLDKFTQQSFILVKITTMSLTRFSLRN
jgi:UDP-N-acetylglucosamine 2-epimerase